MTALEYLRRTGLVVELEGERLRVKPAKRITDNHRQYLRDHRAELVAELSAGNDPPAPTTTEPRRNAWRVTLRGKFLCVVIGESMTYIEALEVARWHWPDADVSQ
ncbi:hypothetical protein D3C75_212390 [compost metagenome]